MISAPRPPDRAATTTAMATDITATEPIIIIRTKRSPKRLESRNRLATVPIRSSSVRWLAGILLVGFAAIYIAASVRLLMASRLSLRGDEQALTKAARLEPSSAEYASILGRVRFFALQDFVGGRHYLKEAVRLNPHNAVYWLDLASLEHAS